jgi:outer membrane protein OmpA-like peptidoglycan-associated protein
LNPPGAAAPPNVAGTGDFATDIAALTTGKSATDNGGLGGGQFGCDLQLGGSTPTLGIPLVFGVEGDFDGTSLQTHATQAFAAFPNVGNPAFTDAARLQQASDALKWVSTIRGKVGLAWNQFMFFGTGGVAFGGYQTNSNVTFGTVPVNPVYGNAVHIGSSSAEKVGVVYGGGIQYALNNNWSLKAEYLAFNFGSQNVFSPLIASAAPAAGGYKWLTLVSNRAPQTVRVGFDYHFGAPPPPPPAPAAMPAPPPAAPKVFIVFFDWDRDTITNEGRQIIAQAADAYRSGAPVQIQVTGYTDRSGSAGYNQRLSERRANNVAKALAALGVPPAQMVVSGRGENDNRVPTANGVREPQNRRVEIVTP